MRDYLPNSQSPDAGGVTRPFDLAHHVADRVLHQPGPCPVGRARVLERSRLPTELLQDIASRLSPADLYRAALVCRVWRASLLGFPLLWTRVCLLHRGTGFSGARLSPQPELISALLSRSLDLPLAIEYQCSFTGDGKWSPVYDTVADALMPHMRRVTSLSLYIPCVDDTPFARLLVAPAPLLECVRLHVTTPHGQTSLRSSVFPGATRLRRLSLSRVDTLERGYVSLRSVTSLCYAGDIDDVVLGQIVALFPALVCLTLVGHRCTAQRSHQGPQSLRLRLLSTENIHKVIDSFPNATSVCLSSILGSPAGSAVLLRLLLASGRPRALDITWDRMHCLVGQELPRPGSLGLVIRLNGVALAVDLRQAEVAAALQLAGMTLFRELHDLTVHADVWLLLSTRLLPKLGNLTIYLRSGDAWIIDMTSRVHHRTALLRLIFSERTGEVSLGDIARFIQANVDAQALRRLVLCGANIASDGVQEPEGIPNLPNVEVIYEERPSKGDFEPWLWPFPEADAIHASPTSADISHT
ncbi:hypothetical protein AURDEDRAFT_185385 [Auricularia subglabra TFB-10046 SS5]|nr:hypothetical protein AURDEDRAFT_185385 [Auricularia subglabra TFB-10046 SS5]